MPIMRERIGNSPSVKGGPSDDRRGGVCSTLPVVRPGLGGPCVRRDRGGCPLPIESTAGQHIREPRAFGRFRTTGCQDGCQERSSTPSKGVARVRLSTNQWRARRDSNPRPSDPKSDALSTELRARARGAEHTGRRNGTARTEIGTETGRACTLLPGYPRMIRTSSRHHLGSGQQRFALQVASFAGRVPKDDRAAVRSSIRLSTETRWGNGLTAAAPVPPPPRS